MRRKIIRQGNKSYTLTLPIDWIKGEQLKGGDEVELKEEDNNLIVYPIKKNTISKDICTIDVNKFNKRAILRTLHHAYRKGYDKVKLVNTPHDHSAYINRIVRDTMIGFEVVHQDKDSYIIEDIAEPSHEKFDSIQRKIFYIIQSELEKVYSSFVNKDFQDILGREEIKKMIDSYTNLCRRLIIKYRIGGRRFSHILMVVMSRLVLIHHAYYNIYKFAATHKKLRTSGYVLKLMHETNNAFKLFHDAYFSKDASKANQLHEITDMLYFKKIPALLLKSKGIDNVIIFYLGEIDRLILMEANLLFGLMSNVS